MAKGRSARTACSRDPRTDTEHPQGGSAPSPAQRSQLRVWGRATPGWAGTLLGAILIPEGAGMAEQQQHTLLTACLCPRLRWEHGRCAKGA